MALISLSYDKQDEELALRLTERFREKGATVLVEPAVDRDRPAIERADGAAARAKASDLVAVLAASDASSMAEATRALRAAAAYNRRVVVGRLEPEASLEKATQEADARRGAAYGEAAQRGDVALRSLDLFEERAGELTRDDEPGFDMDRYDDGRISAFVDQALRGAELGERDRSIEDDDDEEEADGFGFPRSPAAMLSRWRLVEQQNDLSALESFLADYADDPYFAIRAASAIRTERRRMGRQRGAVGYHVTMATLLAAGLIGFGVQACGPEGCSVTEGVDALWSSRGDAPVIAEGGVDAGDSGDEARRIAALLRQSRARTASEAAKARRAETEAAAARGEVSELQVEMAELQEERDDLRETVESLRKSSTSGASAASAAALKRANDAERALGSAQRDVKRLESDQDRLRETLAAARRERDRFQSAAEDRADELAKLRRQLAAAGSQSEATGRSGEEQRLASALRSAQLDLRKSEAEVERLSSALAKAEASNRTLEASLRRSEDRVATAEQAARQAALRSGGSPSAAVAVSKPSAGAVTARPAAKSQATKRNAAAAVRRSAQPRRQASLSGPNVGLRSGEGRRGSRILRTRAADPRAVNRVLSVMREEMRRSPAGRSARAGDNKPYLTRSGVRVVQRCLRSGAGARISVDGVWGRRTTSALLSVRSGQASRVSSCLRNRLRGN